MPIYGEAKRRNMMRSVLPSVARKRARDRLAHIKRRARAETSRSTRRFRGYAEDVIDRFEDDADDLNFYPQHEIRYAVRDRREADKTKPLERWAVAITRDIRQKDRASYIRAMLPGGIIGDHALTHIEFLKEFEDPDEVRWSRWSNPSLYLTDEERTWINNAGVAVLVERMETLCDKGLLKRFNDSVVACRRSYKTIPSDWDRNDASVRALRPSWNQRKNEWYIYEYPRRPLLGRQDIESFLNEFDVGRWHFSWNRFVTLEEVLSELGV